MKTIQKQILALDSHSLSYYQHCPEEYRYKALVQIEQVNTKNAFVQGTYWAKMLEIYYRARIKYESKWKQAGTYNDKMSALSKRLGRSANTYAGFTDIEQNLWSTRIQLYHKTFYRENWIPLAVETGFSFVLYEDSEYLFIYEGRPDLIMSIIDPFNNSKRVTAVCDHKTRAMNRDLIDFNNQVNGYLCATQANYFFYNYCGKQMEGGPAKYFQRQLVLRPQPVLERWKLNTIQWYLKIAHSIRHNKFDLSMQCTGQYGPCDFVKLCSANDKLEYDSVMNSSFKKREREWKAW